MASRFCLLLPLVFLLSCRKSVETHSYPHIELNDCAAIVIGGKDVRICYDELIADSRCPANANCVWMGAATVRLRLAAGGQESAFTISTINHAPGYQNEVEVLGYKVKLINVSPYPGNGQAQHQVEVQVSQ